MAHSHDTVRGMMRACLPTPVIRSSGPSAAPSVEARTGGGPRHFVSTQGLNSGGENRCRQHTLSPRGDGKYQSSFYMLNSRPYMRRDRSVWVLRSNKSSFSLCGSCHSLSLAIFIMCRIQAVGKHANTIPHVLPPNPTRERQKPPLG